MNGKERLGAQAGLTLVEILTAAVVFAIGMLALAGVLVVTNQAREDAVLERAGLEAAQSLMERIRGADPATVLATYDGETLDVPTPGLLTCESLQVASQVASVSPELLAITVSTRWSDGGESRSLDFETQVFEGH